VLKGARTASKALDQISVRRPCRNTGDFRNTTTYVANKLRRYSYGWFRSKALVAEKPRMAVHLHQLQFFGIAASTSEWMCLHSIIPVKEN
jgi:hypothetical protein